MENSNFSNNFLNLIIKRTGYIVFFLALLLISGCFYIWYSYVYNFSWTEEMRKDYMQNKEKGIALDREKFDNFIQESDERQLEFQKDLSITSDVFRLK